MLRFLIALLLICTNVLSVFGQIDTIPEWKQLQQIEIERVSNLPSVKPSLGIEIGHVNFQDKLISPLLYSGFWVGAEFEFDVESESKHYTVWSGGRLGKFKAPTLSDVSTYGNIAGAAVLQGQYYIQVAGEWKLASTPHFLGGFMLLDIIDKWKKQVSVKNYTGKTKAFNSQLILGLSYLYKSEISGMPIRTYFMLPLLSYDDRIEGGIGPNLKRLIAPTLRAELHLPGKKNSFTKLFYTWRFRLTESTPNSTYNYRYNVNSIGIAIGGSIY